MASPYSVDLRERVVARVTAGDPVRKVAATFDVSVASVVKWSQRLRRTGRRLTIALVQRPCQMSMLQSAEHTSSSHFMAQ